MYIIIADGTYRKKTVDELKENLTGATENSTYGVETNKLILDLLQKAQPLNIDIGKGVRSRRSFYLEPRQRCI